MHRLLKRAMLPLTTSALIFTGLSAVATATPHPTTGVELVVDQNRFVAEGVTFDPAVGYREGLQTLKDLPSFVWDINPPFKGYNFEDCRGTLRDAAAK